MNPQFAERAPVCALHVEQILEQHRQVARRLEIIEPLRTRWMETAEAEVRDDLAERYNDLSAVLNVHLGGDPPQGIHADPSVPGNRLLTATPAGSSIGRHTGGLQRDGG
ncbi:hypothetical protein [Pseudarthrobacter sp. NIBRBAC000502772]|uniref:hypothetical protein n=1 Tax=Pseudarthrobacter sp. NIBRBAC000502772 TaxID=2590775 RepID=UPI001AEFC222|nr:hypothetical protein [Pseudarthrobacter sp. NIBRBAC000502772]